MESRQKRPRRAFTPEFKAEVVELCRRGDRSVGQVARDLDLTETAVRFFLSPIGYINEIPVRNTLYGIGYLDTRAQALSAESVLDTAALDKYRFLRNAYLKNRRYQIYEGKPPPEEDDDSPPPPVPPTPLK